MAWRRRRLLEFRNVDPLTRLALAARAGDRAALDQLVEGTYEQVWRLCARLVDEQCADDLAQDAFLRVVRALPAYRAEASARTWLLAIARNTCMDELRTRSRRRRRDATLRAGGAGRVEVATGPEHDVGVTDMLSRLVPEKREAFVLTQLLGLSYDEAALVCGCPPGPGGPAQRSGRHRSERRFTTGGLYEREQHVPHDEGHDELTHHDRAGSEHLRAVPFALVHIDQNGSVLH
jgi:RNA polymerase sigma-70 factor (ECF subfamily)